MADTKQLRSRIRSVRSTLQLTHAMELVASSKIRRALEKKENSAAYADAFEKAMSVLGASRACRKSPWLEEREGGITSLVVIAGDRGLAGGYNANVFRLARAWPDADITPIGKRACERFGGPMVHAETFSEAQASALAHILCEDFLEGRCDRLGILYTRFVSVMSQVTQIRWILPLTRKEEPAPSDIVFEPDERQILDAAVPAYVSGMLRAAVRESFASEVAARRIAMNSAGKNAQQMIDDLQLEYNRARQSAITQEITEIVAGGNA